MAVALLTPAAQQELARRYRVELTDLLGNLIALEQILAEDFPAMAAPPETISRYHLDMIRGLKNGTGALLAGYDN